MNFKPVILFLGLIFLFGCSPLNIPDYIKADRPYVRKMSGDYNRIIDAIKDVFYQEGFLIQSEEQPADYERREGGEDQTRDLLLFTEVKRRFKILFTTYVHWNIFVHATADGAEVDLRYEAYTPGFFKASSKQNPKAANRILDAIEQSL
jgi:hypothetical protein